MKSTEFLKAAIDVQAERGKQYDKPSGERSMAATVSAFNCITGSMLEESDGWMFLGLLKLVRQSQNPEKYHHDSALDFVAYASLYAEAASEQCGQLEAQQKAANNLPYGYSWNDAPEDFDWLATDKEGAFWFATEPVKKEHDDIWKFPGRKSMITIEEDCLPLAKYKRPTSTAK